MVLRRNDKKESRRESEGETLGESAEIFSTAFLLNYYTFELHSFPYISFFLLQLCFKKIRYNGGPLSRNGRV